MQKFYVQKEFFLKKELFQSPSCNKFSYCATMKIKTFFEKYGIGTAIVQ
jgi:hypothetical protein